eukprot:GHRQ01017336.1.p2 GENE.GHRQ01017336.1~~GHRQ01017336.1.p2  ORF type:complete len:207 (-),score=97.93 GHRQ01017336.1:49-669(-)
MELDADVSGKIALMSNSLVQINSLYSGHNDLTNLPADISSLASNLPLPDTSPLTSQLQTADQQLSDAAGDLAQLTAALSNLTDALQRLQPAVDSIGAAVAAFDATDDAANWSALKATLQANGTEVAIAAAVFAAADLGPFVSGTAGSIKQTMDAASGDMSAQVAAIGDVQQSMADFSLVDFATALDGADSAYSSFGGSPASVRLKE